MPLIRSFIRAITRCNSATSYVVAGVEGELELNAMAEPEE